MTDRSLATHHLVRERAGCIRLHIATPARPPRFSAGKRGKGAAGRQPTAKALSSKPLRTVDALEPITRALARRRERGWRRGRQALAPPFVCGGSLEEAGRSKQAHAAKPWSHVGPAVILLHSPVPSQCDGMLSEAEQAGNPSSQPAVPSSGLWRHHAGPGGMAMTRGTAKAPLTAINELPKRPALQFTTEFALGETLHCATPLHVIRSVLLSPPSSTGPRVYKS